MKQGKKNHDFFLTCLASLAKFIAYAGLVMCQKYSTALNIHTLHKPAISPLIAKLRSYCPTLAQAYLKP
jgi:hypothetical protein